MPLTIPSVPEYITRASWLEFFDRCGFDARDVIEFRIARDGAHALVAARSADGSRLPNKHRVFIPTRDDDTDPRTTRINPVEKK